MTSSSAETERNTVSLDTVRQIIERNADNPSAFLALNSGNSYYTQADIDGIIAYRQSGRHLVQFGGPFAAPDAAELLLAGFQAFARARRRRIVAVQLQRADADLYARAGFTVNQLGASYAVDLSSHTLRGSRFMQLRNKISRAKRSGLTVTEVDQSDYADQMLALDRRWLRGKGRHAKPLEFLVGEYGGPMQPHRRLFVGLLDGALAGYISYSPVPGSRPGWLHDLSRRLPDGPPGIMEAINHTAIEVFRGEGVGWLHFGFTPFTGLTAEHRMPTASGWFDWLLRQLRNRGSAVYPAATQLAYKDKWAPGPPIPEYIAFSGGASLAGFLRVFKVSNAL